MEPFFFDLETFYADTYANPFCHFLYFHMGLNALNSRQKKIDREILARPETEDKGTQTDKTSVFWSYFQ